MHCIYSYISLHAGSNFKQLRGLDVEVAHDLLKDVADKEMSIQEMMAECRDVKVLKEIQTAFIRETGTSSWEEATVKFPDFATAEGLDEFRGCSFKSGSTPARSVAMTCMSSIFENWKRMPPSLQFIYQVH